MIGRVKKTPYSFCIRKDCEEFAYCRGLCSNHYLRTRYDIAHGKTTDAKLVRRGEILAKGKRG